MQLAAGQPASQTATWSSFSRWAAATSNGTSAPIWSAPWNTPRQVGATICGIVGRDGGYTAKVADACVIVPTVNSDDGDAACRGVPGGDLALAGLASGPEGGTDRWESAADEDSAAAGNCPSQAPGALPMETPVTTPESRQRAASWRAVFLDRDGVHQPGVCPQRRHPSAGAARPSSSCCPGVPAACDDWPRLASPLSW